MTTQATPQAAGATLHLGGDAYCTPDLAPLLAPIDQLHPFPGNARRGDQDAITASIRDLGVWRAHVVQTSTGHVIVGNHQLRGLLDLGATLAPASWRECDDTTATAIALRDNHTSDLGMYDDHALLSLLTSHEDVAGLAGYEDADVAAIRAAVEAEQRAARRAQLASDPDALPDMPATPPVTARGDQWRLGPHTLICGDATDRTTYAGLPDGGIAATFTSFPYGVGIEYGEDVPRDDFDNVRRLLVAIAPLIAGNTKPGGFCVTNFADVATGREIAGVSDPCEYPAGIDYWAAFRAAEWRLHSRRVWAKPNGAVHSPWVMMSNRAALDWEHLWTWRKPGGTSTTAGRRRHSTLGVWDDAVMGKVEYGNQLYGKDKHPAAFPTTLAELVLNVHSDPGDTVMDPFCGTGTVIIAAERTERIGYGIELSRANCDLICARYQMHTGTTPTRNGEAVDFS